MNKKKTIFISILKIIRPYQWVKNVLVFLPMLMSHNLTSENFLILINAFIIFSLVASSIYVINDIADLKSDQQHSYKKNRPFASGLINFNQCLYLIIFLILISSLLLINLNKNFIFLILTYFIISNLYTFVFKKYIIIDLLILSILHILRIIGGGLIVDISISIWLISFSIFFFIFLAGIKRLIEIINTKEFNKNKIVGRGYIYKNKKIINIISIFSGYMSVIVLILYVNSSQTINLYSSPNILWGICFVMLFWISRMIYISNKRLIKEDPIIYTIKDVISYVCLFLILCIILLGFSI